MSDKNIKNDVAWEALFEKYSILKKINEIGYFAEVLNVKKSLIKIAQNML
ncbi:MAG: hypothetical protein H9536_09045, partial [Aphanizomenon flos-aquae Clear-A1]|nr:hypothetical protein [Aphanizomenon flos-aquae Clear-A1]